MKSNSTSLITDLHQFDEVIDVRTPAEYALDHVPGAVNFPVLSNEERVIVGTKHKQESPFEAKKLGATLIARNIAAHIENAFANRPKNWKPMIYCWRGGKRSGAMGHILRQIGWDAHILQGGYKSYRSWVLEQLKELPQQFHYQVITGRTGSAKSMILEALQNLDCQVLDLEKYANHKGSVLGGHPETGQPGQKLFESQIVEQLKTFSQERPVFIEAESRKVGVLQVPDSLLEKIRSSSCIRIKASMSARIEFLKRDYVYMIQNPALLTEKLSHLRSLLGQEQLDQWQKNIQEQDWDTLVQSLLELHYDRLYERSQERNFAAYQQAPEVATDDLSELGIKAIALDIQAKYNNN
jgi:tRNA 2-selenouridine synthase